MKGQEFSTALELAKRHRRRHRQLASLIFLNVAIIAELSLAAPRPALLATASLAFICSLLMAVEQ